MRVGSKISEGGFSVVFRATDAGTNANSSGSGSGNYHHNNYSRQTKTYALKRIQCDDPERRSVCVREAKVHRELMRYYSTQPSQQQLQQQHPPGSATAENVSYTMPLLGMSFCENNTVCYMLFPLLPHSLRQEVNRRIFVPLEAVLDDNSNADHRPSARGAPLSQTQKAQRVRDALRMPPWSESVALQLFDHLCEGVARMHACGYSHRDIKLENVLLRGSNPAHLAQPVLMDFGSAGPLTRSLATRRDVLEIADEAGQHTTLSYRPPELFVGELRTTGGGNNNANPDDAAHPDDVLDYTKVDVWMLGCTLFAILYGASPGECEFSDSTGQIRIVDCTHNKVLGPLPRPSHDTPPARWYSPQVTELLEWILTQDRHQRPTLTQVQSRVRQMVLTGGIGGRILGDDLGGDGNVRVDVESQVDMMFSTSSVQ